MIEKSCYLHPGQNDAERGLTDCLKFEEEILHYYKQFDEKLKKPDLLGKTVMVTARQFSGIHRLVEKTARLVNVPPVPVYVYEDFYYGVESKGTDQPWIEVSAKTLSDLTELEIEFLFAREFCRISMGAVKLTTLADQSLKAISHSALIPGADTFGDALKIKLCKWSRLSQYSADCFGYLAVGDLAACSTAILKLVLNNVELASQVDIMAYVNQTEQIHELDDTIYRFAKNDERVPYGPFRLKYLLAYACSKRAMQANKEGAVSL